MNGDVWPMAPHELWPGIDRGSWRALHDSNLRRPRLTNRRAGLSDGSVRAQARRARAALRDVALREVRAGVDSNASSASRMNRSGCRRLATEMSSSIASQWMPIPPPIGSQAFRCRGEADTGRGNHSRGTETERPSSSTTVNESSEHETSTANASLVSAETGIPVLQEEIPMLVHKPPNCGQLVTPKPAVRRSATGSSQYFA